MAFPFQTLPASGAKLGADPVTTYDGAADSGGAYAELSKIGWGAAGYYNNISLTAGLPTNTAQVGSTNVNAFPAGFQRTTDEPRQLFYDPFDAALDTTNRWNAAVNAGGGVAASVALGLLTLGTGTTANGYSYLNSQTTFAPTVPAWLGNSWAVQIESGATAGNNGVRFWGLGSVGGTPSSASPLGATGNGYGYELDIAGVLQAVVYAGGARTVVASLAALQPTDGAMHRYICFYRTDKIYWYIDGLGSAQLAATSNFQGPQVQTLPLLALAVAHSTGPAASRVFTCSGLAVSDTGKNSTTLSDGTYGWRKATINAAGALSVASQVANGQTVHSTPSTGSPVRVGGRVYTTIDTTLVGGDASDLFITSSGALVEKPFSVPEMDWSFASAAGGIVNTTDVVLKAAGVAGVRNYLTGLSIQNSSATVSTEVVVKDGSTVIGRWFLGTVTQPGSSVPILFPSPLRGTAATALNVACITTGAAVYVNAQGYQAA